jgi:putative oxidoreductase
MSDLLAAIGRIFLPIGFVVDGYGKFTDIQGTANYIGSKIPAMPQLEQWLGMPSPTIYSYAAAGVELLGGILIIVGLFTRTAAAALFIFAALTIYFFHPFWTLDGAQATAQQIHALKNLAIMGGLLLLVAYGPGRFSISGRRSAAPM